MGNAKTKVHDYIEISHQDKEEIKEAFLQKYSDTKRTHMQVRMNFEYAKNNFTYILYDEDINLSFKDEPSVIAFVCKLNRPFVIHYDFETGVHFYQFVYGLV